MALLKMSSPHVSRRGNAGNVMQQVMLACVPGVLMLTWFFGYGTLINIVIGCAVALASEAAILKLRGRNPAFYLKDCSALVTAVLLGIALPPLAPWWLITVGTLAAIILGKQLYGGMGFNPFNPAMVGYVILLISFPVEMTQWVTPRPLLESAQFPGLLESLHLVFTDGHIDAVTGATPLDVFKQRQGVMASDLYAAEPLFINGHLAGAGWEWVNIAFLLGGLLLLARRVFTWHTPVSMLASLLLLSIIFYDGGSSNSGGSPMLHLFSGATMFGAFFIATDPVSSAVSTRGRIIYGAAIGALVYVIRVWGNYPDAVAFAVLLMNIAAPFIDYYTVPRTYGHKKSRRATEKGEK